MFEVRDTYLRPARKMDSERVWYVRPAPGLALKVEEFRLLDWWGLFFLLTLELRIAPLGIAPLDEPWVKKLTFFEVREGFGIECVTIIDRSLTLIRHIVDRDASSAFEDGDGQILGFDILCRSRCPVVIVRRWRTRRRRGGRWKIALSARDTENVCVRRARVYVTEGVARACQT